MPFPPRHPFRVFDDGNMHNVGAGHLIVMLIGLVLLAAIVAAAIFAVVRFVDSSKTSAAPTSTPPAFSGTDAAESTLRMRLATGEINEDEFRSRWSALHANV